MTCHEYEEYEAAIRAFRAREGITHFVVGYIDCPECKVPLDFEAEKCPRCGMGFDSINEPAPSRRDCDCCGDTNYGNHEHATAFIEATGETRHYTVCEDCALYNEHGRLDDRRMAALVAEGYGESSPTAPDRMTDEQLEAQYGPPIVALLTAISRALSDTAIPVDPEPYPMHDDEHSWWLTAYPSGAPAPESLDPDSDVDVTITILESEVRDGEEDGVSFSLNITERGGAMVGGFTPFNYTDAVWVSRRDPDAVAERWRLFVDYCTPDGVANRVRDHARERRTKGTVKPT